MANGNNVPLGAYVDPLLRVDWAGRYISAHQGYYRLTGRAVLLYVTAIFGGLILNLAGLRPLNILTGATFQVVALGGLTAFGNALLVWGLGFAAGQPGGEKGFSLKDGFDKGNQLLFSYFRFVGYFALYGALPFMLLGVLSVWDDPIGALVLLGLSASLALAGVLYYEKTRAFLYLVWVVYLAIYLWILAGFIPGLRELKVQASDAGSGFIATRIVDNPADMAKKKAEAIQRDARIKAAQDCFDKLPATPAPEAKAKCDSLHAAIDRPLLEDTKPVTDWFKGLGKSSSDTSATNAATPAASTPAAPSAKLSQTVTTTLPEGFDPREVIEVCGLKAGIHSYRVYATPVFFFIGGNDRKYQVNPSTTIMNDWALRLANKMPGEQVEVGSSGCAKMRFDIPPGQQPYVDLGQYRLAQSASVKIVLE